ncbi:MAG: FtsX-like permease family protein [Campylobacterota bacterium]|nr:FtsX-like permease family protein [Campylobacterota bacterium]
MFSLAIKNIMHYKGRSLTTFFLSLISALLFVVYVAFMDGSHESMLKNTLSIYTGPIQVMQQGYRDNKSYDYILEDVSSIEKKLDTLSGVSGFAARLESYALLSADDDSVGSMITGIEPEAEMRLSKLKEALHEGRYLEKNDANAIYIGSELALRLKVKPGDTIAFIGSATDYSFAADNLKVIGTFKTGLFEFDASSSFVNKSYFDELMLSENMASYIVVGVNDLDSVESVVSEIEAIVPKEVEVASWKLLMASMVQAMEVDSIFGYISMALFFVVIFFVIMIFGFINVSARIKEFGLLRALGLEPADISRLLFLETALLAFVSVMVGAVIGGVIAYYFELHPIIIEGMAETYKEYGIVSDAVPTRFDLWTVFWNAGVVLILDFLAIVYPIYYIRQFSPTEAMRHV